jgi:predicted TIM-barrel fold metal-dependent hydrolase
MMKAIDGDSHFIEPLNLFDRYIDPRFRERAMRVARDSATGELTMLVDGKPMRLGNVAQLLGAVVSYGEKEQGRSLHDFDAYQFSSAQWQDMGRRVKFLDDEGFAAQVIYPTMGILWQGDVHDPQLADALCRAYNSWAFELCAAHKDRLVVAAHISLLDATLAVREIGRVAKLGCKTIFVASAPIDGHGFGHPDLDPVWAAAQEANLSVGIHLVGHSEYTGSQWCRGYDPGFMFLTMNVIQDPRMALTTMVYDGVLERFPKLRVATIEAMAGWVGEWLERLDYRFKYMGHTAKMKRPASEYFARNIWISADPEERMLPLMVEFAGADRFFVGSDYPHAEGFVNPVAKTRERLAKLPEASVRKVLYHNAKAFYGI